MYPDNLYDVSRPDIEDMRPLRDKGGEREREREREK
jgi:hypothetical protein